MSILAWVNNLDVLVNFLIVIDLGVFLTLLAFACNLVFIFESVSLLKKSTSRSHIKIVFGLTPVLLSSLGSNNLINLKPLFLDYMNWYSVLNNELYSDMQLLSEIYFSYNFLEFIIMNLIMYLGLLTAISVSQMRLKFANFKHLMGLNNILRYRPDNNNLYKLQNIQSQVRQSSTVRAWSGHINVNNLNDSKRDMGTVDW